MNIAILKKASPVPLSTFPHLFCFFFFLSCDLGENKKIFLSLLLFGFYRLMVCVRTHFIHFFSFHNSRCWETTLLIYLMESAFCSILFVCRCDFHRLCDFIRNKWKIRCGKDLQKIQFMFLMSKLFSAMYWIQFGENEIISVSLWCINTIISCELGTVQMARMIRKHLFCVYHETAISSLHFACSYSILCVRLLLNKCLITFDTPLIPCHTRMTFVYSSRKCLFSLHRNSIANCLSTLCETIHI